MNRRSRRYIPPRHMSVAIFADYSLTRWFEQFGPRFLSIENYIQDIMGISSTIMKHPSLEQDISLEIVEITIIKKFHEGPYPVSSKQVDADELLTRFCQWQHELNDHNPTSRGHWDVVWVKFLYLR